MKADGLANNMSNDDYDKFWRNVKAINNSKLRNSTTVGSVTGAEAISNMWADHYKGLFNSVTGNKQQDIDKLIEGSILDVGMTISALEVKSIIKQLPLGKSAGNDGLCAYIAL